MIVCVKKIVRKLLNYFHFVKRNRERKYKKLINKQILDITHNFCLENKKIYVFGSPYHSNLGDQAQSYCIDLWLKENYPDYKHFIIDSLTLSKNDYEFLKVIAQNIKPDDIIFLHSGYHLTDLYWLENDLIIKTVQLFSNNKIIILPQTINYSSSYDLSEIKEAFKSNKNVFLMCRDEESYLKASLIFKTTPLLLFPDVVTTMIGRFPIAKKQNNKVLLCVRNDKEAFYTKNQIADLSSKLKEANFNVLLTDTTILRHPFFIIKNRKKYLEQEWEKFSKSTVTITDRYHGTIFSLIGNTPVIVLGTTDHKLKSGVKWFRNSFNNFVYFANNLDEAFELAKNILNVSRNSKLPNYFEIEYYDKLKGIIDGDR